MRIDIPGLFVILFQVVLLCVAGCSALPRTVPVTPDEEIAVSRSFLDLVRQQEQCGCCLDVQVTARLDSIFQKGTIDGYLEIMRPSYGKFIGVNPLGQPLMILATNGAEFQYISVAERRIYEGSVRSKAFVKHAPAGFSPQQSFYWLTGRIPFDGMEIVSVARDESGSVFWLEIVYPGGTGSRHIQVDISAGKILRQLVLGSSGKMEMELSYGGYQAASPTASAACLLPGTVEVISDKHGGAALMFFFTDWQTVPGGRKQDFVISGPAAYEKVSVK